MSVVPMLNTGNKSNMNKDITISDISMDLDRMHIRVTVKVLPGESYTLRASEAESGIIIQDRIIRPVDNNVYHLGISMNKGREYTFALIDKHGVPHDEYTVMAPQDFSALPVLDEFDEIEIDEIIGEVGGEYTEVPEPIDLDQTNDIFGALPAPAQIIIPAVIILLVATKWIWRWFKRKR